MYWVFASAILPQFQVSKHAHLLPVYAELMPGQLKRKVAESMVLPYLATHNKLSISLVCQCCCVLSDAEVEQVYKEWLAQSGKSFGQDTLAPWL